MPTSRFDSNAGHWKLILIGAAATLLVNLILFIKPTFIQALSNQINDIKFHLNHSEVDQSLLFVDIDHKSIKEFGRWPWHRDQFSELLMQLKQARVVVLDMVFSEQSEQDASLVNAFESLPIVQGVIVNNQLQQIVPIKEEQKAVLLDSALHEIQLNLIQANTLDMAILSLLESATLNGSISTFPDSDGLFRKYPLGFELQGSYLPALGVQVIRLLENTNPVREEGELVFNQKVIPIPHLGITQINMFDPNEFKHISAVDIRQKPSNFFKDKIIFIGLSEAGLSDLRATPFGQIPGVFLHMMFVNNYLNQTQLKSNAWFDHLMVIILGTLPLLLLIKQQLSVTKRLFFIIVAALAFISINLLLYLHFNFWTGLFYPLIALLLTTALMEYFSRKQADESLIYIRNAFSNYLSPKVIDQITSDSSHLKLGGEEREITVLFCDIRNFTTLSEAYQPEEVVNMLKDLFTPLTADILKHHGLLDKYIGDAIMAIFNTPVDDPEHAKHACMSGLAMLKSVEKFNKSQRKKNLPEISIGIGIHTGKAVVGNIGSKQRFDYTAIGDTVNTASRIEGQTKHFQQNILISEVTKTKVEGFLETEFVTEAELKGKKVKIRLYTPSIK